jgi:granule-bound starch synthase
VSLQVFDAKPLLKEALQAEVGLPVDADIPVIGFIGRLEEQKGSDILAEAVSQILQDDVQLIILVSPHLFPFLSNNPHLFFL